MVTNATNATENLQYPLFVGSDKPSWLTDWNNTMSKLDEDITNTRKDFTELKPAIEKNTEDIGVITENLSKTTDTANTNKTAIEELTTTVGNHTESIETISNDLLTQNDAVQELQQTVSQIDTEAVTELQEQVATNTSDIRALKASQGTGTQNVFLPTATQYMYYLGNLSNNEKIYPVFNSDLSYGKSREIPSGYVDNFTYYNAFNGWNGDYTAKPCYKVNKDIYLAGCITHASSAMIGETYTDAGVVISMLPGDTEISTKYRSDIITARNCLMPISCVKQGDASKNVDHILCHLPDNYIFVPAGTIIDLAYYGTGFSTNYVYPSAFTLRFFFANSEDDTFEGLSYSAGTGEGAIVDTFTNLNFLVKSSS